MLLPSWLHQRAALVACLALPCSFVVASTVITPNAMAAETNPKTTYLDAAAAGEDFAIQGEYAVEGWGLQVIADGDGKFRGVLYKGGLPGAGFDGATDKFKLTGSTKDKKTLLSGSDYEVLIENGHAVVRHKTKSVELAKVERKSPTLGAPAPEGAVVLFDGSNLDHWVKASKTDDNLLNVGPRTKDKFSDYTLHLEFRTPYMPYARGQARGNSGLYLGDQYETQVLDSFGLDGADNECGGIYINAKPRVNMCLPPLAWQTYDVDFQVAKFDDQGNVTAPAKTTVRHNGVVIHENLELKPTPGGGQKDQKPGALFLQDHGDKVHFRNIWIIKK